MNEVAQRELAIDYRQAASRGLLRADYVYLSSTYVDKDQYEGQYLPGVVG